MSNAWTEEDTEKLITLYEQYQCLWNPFHSEFNNKSSRYEAYREMKSSMNISGLTICDCIERIASTKRKYCYELSKIAAAIFCEKLYAPKAKWFRRMHVLLFPHVAVSRHNNSRKRDSVERRFHRSDTRDNLSHSPSEISADKGICSSETCGMRESPQIELCLRFRSSIQSVSKLQDAAVPSCTTGTVDVATEISSNTAERGTQTDTLHERDARVSEGQKDRSTRLDDISMRADGDRKIEDNFDVFGKSIAFQLRTVDIRTAVELEREIQSLLTKARLKTLESGSMAQSSASVCCCECSGCKITCKDDTCGCGLTLKECLLLTKFKDSKGYEGFCYK